MKMKKGYAPKLRFPEFQNDVGWDIATVGSKATKVGSGITPKGGDKNYKKSGRPFIRSQNIGWGHLILDDVAFIDDDTHSTFSSTEIKANDVLLNITGASIGRSAVADSDIQGGNVNQHVCIIRTKKSELKPYFLNQYLLSSDGQKQIDSFQAGGNRQGLNFAQIRSFSFLLPSVKEQQKIADCLSSLDSMISLQTQKIDALQQYKKGLTQKLFPAEGEMVPELRFGGFRDSANWDKKALNKLLTIGSGKDYKHLSTGNIPVYGSGGYMLSVNDYLYDGESVCIGRKGTIDKPIFLTGKFWTVDTLFYTHSFIKCSPKFIFYQFQKINWKNYNEAGGIPSLSKTTIGKIEIPIPSFVEQQKIADCLSSLDRFITHETQKLTALKTHKTGLMQQLFPEMDEVKA
ncbi:restriction endonuclease subunit S [Citrobacter portucalensis]|uniref:restriction endonuclease subunit S n=1 Tax=Citrobacter portucalensis TaxID=1639133 RepID=UPI00226B7E6A|nr:restriction endonuclease subunit S [Citrobacter portucalensis]MCX8982784.1 restriction endonuclease subunit S [Citrobacter portucalensis]